MNSLVIGGLVVIAGLVFFFFLSGDSDPRIPNQASDENGVVEIEEEETAPVVRTGTTIDRSGEGLTRISAEFFQGANPETLDLSNNRLTGALPAEVRHMSNLRVLDLSDNDFTGVPAEIGQLSKLEILDLSNNPITGLPYELGNLKNLKVLDLRGTSFAEADLEVIKRGLPASVEIRTD